ncbi:MAG: cytochrome c [Ardenticatenaceae bacterium]|nr:cytochrome c [Ardenticatenaceae bacterium]
MKKHILLFITAIFTLLLPACSSPANENAAADTSPETTSADATTNNETPARGMGMGMGNGGMMARHHATIPQEYAGLTNPIPADDASIERGAATYTLYCATCHGDGGMGDGPAGTELDPAPAAIAHTSQMLGDDYQFWRISEGGSMEPFNSAMIAWKDVLDEDARWDVINYVQALGSGQTMPRQAMGGATFDPQAEQAQRTEMLTTAVAQNIITQPEADNFSLVHTHVDKQMAGMDNNSMGGMDAMLPAILTALIDEGTITQTQADSFMDVHDRLGAAGLMQ